LQTFLSRQQEKLFIGYNEPAIHSFLPGVLAAVRRKKPQLQLQLRELETAEQWELLKKGELDIGFMRPFDMDMSGLASRLILREKYVLAMPETHWLTGKMEIGSDELAGEEIILFAREVNPAAYDHLTGIFCAACGKTPRFRQDARNKSSMLAMVQAGFGVALLPESCSNGAPAGIIFRTVNMDLPPVDIMAVWDPGNAGVALKDFLQYISCREQLVN
jgi:DNA-binding transcriptional LysR family regulator